MSNYMFLIRHAAWVTPLNFLIVRLESHALFYYDPAAMLERISSPIGVEAPEVVEMCGDPDPAAMLERISSPIGVEAPEVVEICGDPLPVRFA